MILEELKLLANKRDVPYQSLLKIFLAERIEQELRGGILTRREHRRRKKSPRAMTATGSGL